MLKDLKIDFPAVLALNIFITFAVVIVASGFIKLPIDPALVQVLTNIVLLMVGFYFGSSKESQKKTDAMIANPPAGPPPVASADGTASGSTAVKAATAVALAAFMVMLAMSAPAFAQRADDLPRVGTAKKGLPIPLPIDPLGLNKSSAESGGSLRQKILTDMSKPFQDLADFIGDDAEKAIALSTSIPGLQDGHGQQCWIMARNFTAVIKAHPLPLTGQGMSDLEAGRLLAASANQLCGDSHCTQVFTDLKNQAVILAQAGFGVLGATAVNAAPGLQDICNKVATVKMVDPVLPVPSAPVIAPVTSVAPAAPQ